MITPVRHTKMFFLTLPVLAIALASALVIVAFEKGNAQGPATAEKEPASVGNNRNSGEGSSALRAEAPFLQENATAMAKMMHDMSIKPTGDIDRDFVDMMVPHHQGAIDMAKAELRYGKNEQLRRLAQEIIVTQQQEIAAMRLAVGEPLPPSVPSPTTVGQSSP
ncbi:MAG TPA: DUF305 domain-containing protein [Planctomycetaceae bacterium]|jgi:hypothetical protein|nr:DUF305 domain-containing protein [Planctomycetaceae bacterium]